MENIATRTRFLTANIIDEIDEYDLGSFDPKDYDWGDQFSYIMVTKYEVGRPDILSYNIYGTQNYWWLLMWFNGITDVWNDLTEELVLKCPPKEKMSEFVRLYSHG